LGRTALQNLKFINRSDKRTRMKNILIILIVLTGNIQNLIAQNVKDFYYVEPETKNLPVFIRGNLDQKKILLFVQGGDADNGIDFGRSDYPGWKNTLEKRVAIAYFDQRGLNRSVKKIDTTKINASQVLKDIITIAKSLKEKYNAEIYLFGHSNGGRQVLECFANFPDKTSFINAGIVFNTPITTDFSPERYTHYRPLYLKNLAQEFIAKGENTTYWQEAYNWILETDSISTPESSEQWNVYVDNAYPSTKRKIGLGMVLKTIFTRPYNPIKYLNNKDNQFVGDKLWFAQKALWDANQQTTLWEQLPKIEHPVLLMTGRYDAVATSEEQEKAHQLLQNSELVLIQNCTHESFLDQPEKFSNAVSNYINIK
jgi:pimeloyl-ACP methyl ester carboxylesterase